MAGVTTKPGEAAQRRRAAVHYGVGEASPPAVSVPESVLSERLDVVAMSLDRLKERSAPWFARPVNGRTGVGMREECGSRHGAHGG
jgi:hypothetical protein